jgi:ribose/xylose/arabinose/galactoside ABC-type transport system permease subunit
LSFALLIFVLPIRPEILSWTNLETLALAIALLSVLAIGESFVLITAGIDLSLPAVMSLASVLGASVLVHQAFAVSSFGALVGAVGLMLATGVLLGLLHGISVAYFKMPAFLVSLASLMLVGGVAVWYTESSRVNVTADFIDIWYGRLLGIPYPILLSAFTVNGRRLYAVGHSLKTARLSGVPVERTLIFAYVASGLCAAIASVLYTARLHTGSPELVENEVLLDCIGAAVIGGTSLFGGKGKIAGIVMGAAFIALVSNSLNMLGLRYWHVIMIKGGVILLAATLDAVQRRLIVNGQNQ